MGTSVDCASAKKHSDAFRTRLLSTRKPHRRVGQTVHLAPDGSKPARGSQSAEAFIASIFDFGQDGVASRATPSGTAAWRIHLRHRENGHGLGHSSIQTARRGAGVMVEARECRLASDEQQGPSRARPRPVSRTYLSLRILHVPRRRHYKTPRGSLPWSFFLPQDTPPSPSTRTAAPSHTSRCLLRHVRPHCLQGHARMLGSPRSVSRIQSCCAVSR